MPLALTTPGVYVQELPSGSRTITGVSTSLTAFVGQALRGPVDVPTRIFSFADFERGFGGLWTRSPLSQSVRHYFLNGGREALIVRVVNREVPSQDAAAAASVVLPVATSRMLLRATTAASAVSGFHQLEVTSVPTGATTFDVTVEAQDVDGNVLTDAGGDFSYTVSLDTTGNISAALAAATTGNTAAITLVELVGPAPTGAPDAATSTSFRASGVHYVALSRTASMKLVATSDAQALAGFDHLELVVRNVVGNTFDLDVTARDGSGVVLDDGTSAATYTSRSTWPATSRPRWRRAPARVGFNWSSSMARR